MSNNYLEIPLNGLGTGKWAKVSVADYQLCAQYSWFYRNGYALTDIKGKEIRMHRLIMNEYDPKWIIDHKNRDRLDNRRENLRRFTLKQNANNMMTNRKILAFGEWKTIAEWSEDIRCGCNYNTLIGRLNKYIEPELAILAKGVK